MAKFEIEMVIRFSASDIEEAEKHSDELSDIISESGFEAVEVEIGPAIEEY
jgi:hypothetical protein